MKSQGLFGNTTVAYTSVTSNQSSILSKHAVLTRLGTSVAYTLHHLTTVDNIPLGIAIRYILDALNCPPDTNLFRFSIQAVS